MLDHPAVLIKLDCTKTNRRAGALTLILLGVKLGIFENDARADDFSIAAHWLLLLATVVQNILSLVVEAVYNPILGCDVH